MGVIDKEQAVPVEALSPTRVDLAGGTLDIMPLTSILEHKTTVNFGITLHAAVQVTRRDREFQLVSHDQKVTIEGDWSRVTRDGRLPLLERLLQHFWHPELPALRLETKAKSPAGAGLGGSSCLAIATASALLKARADAGMPLHLDERQLVQQVQDLETAVIRVPTGCQDYWGGLRGGINIIRYPPGGAQVETLRDHAAQELDHMLLLCYSGVSRASGTNNWAIFRKAFEGDAFTLSILNEIGTLSEALAQAVKSQSWSEVFRLSAAEWQLRAQLWSDIETPETKTIATAAKSAGALFTRICGAGGGGVMAIFAPSEAHMRVRDAMIQAGGRVLEGRLCWQSTEVKGEFT
jgi:D-glycero-alpha-D-manno-heptose-7-phosphate kinase